MGNDAACKLSSVLSNRVALLQALKVSDDCILPAGTLGTLASDPHGETIDVVINQCHGTELNMPRKACAVVRMEGALPLADELSVMFSAVVGSRAQDLADEDSDFDRRGFYLSGPGVHFSLVGAPAQLVHDQDQLCLWEVEKFLKLALKANPTVLETLYSPCVELCAPKVCTDLDRLRRSGAFLSRRAHQTFVGYANSQFEKMSRAREHGGVFKWKHAMHLIRILRIGVSLIRSGELDVVVPTKEREELLAIKRGDCDWNDVIQLRSELVQVIDAAVDQSPLPAEPNIAAVSKFLFNLRVAAVQALE